MSLLTEWSFDAFVVLVTALAAGREGGLARPANASVPARSAAPLVERLLVHRAPPVSQSGVHRA